MTTTSSARKFTLLDPHVFSIFIREREIVETRILQGRNVTTGCFDNHTDFRKAVMSMDRNPHGGIYFTLQVIDPRLLGRSHNRLKQGISTTSDNNVLAYRWLPIDIDPVRPSGVSSSDSELREAYNVREEVVEWMADNLDFTDPVKAMSGNGYHLLYRLPDIKNNQQNRVFIKHILETLDDKFSTSAVGIDTTVFNPGRIWKLYGTTAKKGDPIPATVNREERPHRMSYIEDLGGCK
jgi:hypothetical protein